MFSQIVCPISGLHFGHTFRFSCKSVPKPIDASREICDNSLAQAKFDTLCFCGRSEIPGGHCGGPREKRNGHLSNDLKELKLSGFLAGDQGRNPKTGELALSTCYQLKDNYARPCLKYIELGKDAIDDDSCSFIALVPFRMLLGL